MSHLETLSKFFGIRMVRNPNPDVEGVLNLRHFANQFGDEVQLDEVNCCVRFMSGKHLFVIRCDVDASDNNRVVYQGYIKTFRPETTVAYTDYLFSIRSVLDELKNQVDALRAQEQEA